MDNFFIPTRDYIESLTVGDLVPNCWGDMVPITKITAKKEDVNGKLFCCYYTQFGPHSEISGSIKEGRLYRNVGLCNKYTSAQLDNIERILSGKP